MSALFLFSPLPRSIFFLPPPYVFFFLLFLSYLRHGVWFRICRDTRAGIEDTRNTRVKRVSLTVLGKGGGGEKNSSLSLTMLITSRKRAPVCSPRENTKSLGRRGGGVGIFDYGDRDLNADNYASSGWKNVETRRIKEGYRGGRPRLAIGCVFRVFEQSQLTR